MTAWLPVLVPLGAGIGAWAWRPTRRVLGSVALAVGLITLALAVWVAWAEPTSVVAWGAGLELRLEVAPIARLPIVLVPFVATAIVGYATAHEHAHGLARMVGLLIAFVGAMELLLLAGDLLTLLIGWELVGAISWGLIAHEWQTPAPAKAAQAFNATRFGDLGLFLAAGAAFSATGSLAFSDLARVTGGARTVLVAGVVLAAVAKSAQLPFSPWLFSAMAGPTPASALLHSATMVAAGVYLLARLEPVLATVGWFSPLAVTLGLLTALAGGVVAVVQDDAKRLLAASTSAQYGLMLVAVGAGYPLVAIAHLVAHGLFKALLFLSAGVAVSASGSNRLAAMALGRALRPLAILTATGTAALAAVPPLGAAWTKEQVVAAGAHVAPWVGLLVIVAGGLSAFYAARFQLLAYGPPRERRRAPAVGNMPGAGEHTAVAVLGVACIALGVLWLPVVHGWLERVVGGTVPTGTTWEVAGSLGAVAVGGYAAYTRYRRGRLARLTAVPPLHTVADWFAIPAATEAFIVAPTLRLAHAAGRFDDVVIDGVVARIAGTANRAAAGFARADDRVVDGGVRGTAAAAARTAQVLDRVAELSLDSTVEGLARVVGAAGRDTRRVQTGQTHTYYALIAIGTVVLVAVTAVWSR